MKMFRKADFPVSEIRRFLEPGPIVLVSSAWQGKSNVMTMGWHMMLGFSPARFGCYIWDANHSFAMIRRSRQCVINLPTTDLIDETIGIGNCSGATVDEFHKFGITPVPAAQVKAPLIRECYANFECKLADGGQIARHGLFVWEVVQAHVAASPKYPETFHYRGDGVFMISGCSLNLSKKFKPENL
ncbi:MAG: flavin reductase family protein [Planctomycetes bacterium]|nr:flavin reductase family protein [Planctomycetota bacterium]